jgi:hypothetical protein
LRHKIRTVNLNDVIRKGHVNQWLA